MRLITSALRNCLIAVRPRRLSVLPSAVALCLTVLLLGVIAPHVWAQASPYDSFGEDSPYETTASLNVDMSNRGLTASFYTPYTQSEEDESAEWTSRLQESAVESAVMAAAGCQFVEKNIYVEDYISVWGECNTLQQVDLGWQGKLRLSSLTSLLSQTPMTHLKVTVSLPQVEEPRLTPAGELPFESIAGARWMNRFAANYRIYSVELANPEVTEISYWYGFTRGQIALDILGLALVLVVPIAVMVWLRQRALSTHVKAQAVGESIPIWFGYQRWSAWVETITWFAWITALSISSAVDWVVLFLPEALLPVSLNQHLLTALGMAMALLPAMLLVLINRCLSFRVMSEVGQLNYSFKEVLLQYFASQGLILCIGTIAIAWPALFTGHWLSYVSIALASLGILLCLRVSKKLKDWTPYAITTGELRDRVFTLAKPTGIQLKQLYLLPMKRSRLLNACAVKNDTVMVTDYLLKHLSKDEVDGVMAHEIAHLQLGHTKKLLWQLIITGVVTVWLMQLLSALTMIVLPPAMLVLYIPLGLLIVFLFFYRTSRKFEYQADAQGVLLTGNPQAAITGLVKLTRFNQMPMQWGKLSESLATHPSLQRRVDAIAKHYDLPEEEVNQLITNASQAPTPAPTQAPSAHYYDLNTAELSNEQRPIFSSQLQQKLGQQMLLASITCFTVLPSVLGLAVQFLPTPGLRWMGYVIAGLVTIAIYGYVRNVGPTWGFGKLRQQIAARLHSQGFDAVSDTEKSTFVGFSPGAKIQMYEGCTEWDVGFLVLAQGQLCYVGERVKFAIAPNQITQIARTIESPEGLPIEAITLTWQAADLTSHTYRFQPLNTPSVRQTKVAAKRLQDAIESWLKAERQNDQAYSAQTTEQTVGQMNLQTESGGDLSDDPSDEACLYELSLPELGTVTSRSFPNFTFSNFLVIWLLQLLIGNIAATVLSAAEPLRLFIVTMVTIGTILQNLSAIRRTIS